MKPRLLFLLALLLIGADSQRPDLAIEKGTELDGTWDVVTLVYRGTRFPSSARWSFAAKKIATADLSGKKFGGVFQIGCEGGMNTLDIQWGNGFRQAGIFKFEDGNLIISTTYHSNEPRPTTFDERGYMLIFRRATPR